MAKIFEMPFCKSIFKELKITTSLKVLARSIFKLQNHSSFPMLINVQRTICEQ